MGDNNTRTTNDTINETLQNSLLKIEVLCSKEYTDKLIEELKTVTTGQSKHYEVFTVVPVTNYYTKLSEMFAFEENEPEPELGKQVKREENKIEFTCQAKQLSDVMAAIIRVHPYTHAPIRIYPLV